MDSSLNPINSLHPELLVQIFSLVLDDSTSVSRVDVFEPFSLDPYDLDKSSRQANLKTSGQDDRPAGSCTDNTARCFLDTVNSNNAQFHKLPESTLNDALLETPFGSKQIRTLSLNLWETRYFNALLENWFSTGVSNTLTKLRIQLVDGANDPAALQSWLSQCQELQLLQLNVAPLCDAHFPLLPKLVDLKLSTSAGPLTTLQFANMLRGCPNLRRLTLEGMDIHDTPGVDITPVPLQHLRVLLLNELDTTHVFPMISSKSDSLSLTITASSLYETSGDLIDYINQLSQLSPITALELSVGDIGSRDLRKLLISLPQLQTLSLVEIYMDNHTALALRGANALDAGKETTTPAFPIPSAIWLIQSVIDDEAALRSLVGVRPLQQLKLDGCVLSSPRYEPIPEAKEVYKYLLDSVPDLIIIDE